MHLQGRLQLSRVQIRAGVLRRRVRRSGLGHVQGWVCQPLHYHHQVVCQLRYVLGRRRLQDRLFDLLDERPLLPSQVKEFVEKLLSCGALPEPEVDPKGFKMALEQRLKEHPMVYNAVSKTMAPWVNTNRIGKGGGDCAIS